MSTGRNDGNPHQFHGASDLIKNSMLKINVGCAVLACVVLSGMLFSNAASATDIAGMIEPCFACHGKGGVSSEAEVPSIAGYSEDYFSYSLELYQKKERPCIEAEYHTGSKIGQKTSMCEIVRGMSESEIEQMSEYFAEQKFVRSRQTYNAELAKQGEEIHINKCDECHSKAGSSPEDNAGFLGGQKMDYLREQIKFVRNGQRFTSKKMRLRLEALGDGELEAVVHYYGSIH
jgi:cytochrome subunit of sulfide dehydrogenase